MPFPRKGASCQALGIVSHSRSWRERKACQSTESVAPGPGSFAELQRAKTGWVDPADVKFDQAGALNSDYYPGDIGFDPLGLKPEDPEELDIMITKELQNGRLAMLAAAGFLAQEAVDGKGILEHFSS